MKNKMLWIIAFVLLISIPSAFAQTGIFANPWIILAINVFIVWVVLFILQAFLITKTSGRDNVIAWVASFALSILIVLVFVGFKGFIWQIEPFSKFFKGVAIINTILIAGLAYLGLLLLGIKQESAQGKVGTGVLIILFAGIIASNMEYPLWHTETFRALYDYGLGETGILRPEEPHYRLFIFIGFSVLFSWFFIAFLKVGEGNNKLYYIMAIIIGAHLARSGISTDTLIRVGEIMSMMIIGKQLGGSLANYITAAFLVGWISVILFGQKGIAGFWFQNLVPSFEWTWQNFLKLGANILVFILVYKLLSRGKMPALAPATATAGGGKP